MLLLLFIDVFITSHVAEVLACFAYICTHEMALRG